MAKTPGKFAMLFIFITVMLNMIGLGVIMPVMPQLIMDVTGEPLARAAQWGGFLSFAYAIMQFIMMPIIGGLSDRYGRRPILLASMAAYSFDFLIMAVAPTMGIIVVARLLAGAFAATFSTANAYIADISPPEKRAANFGLMGAAFGLGFIIGPGIGGFLGDEFGPRAPFYFVALLGALNFLFGLVVLPETLAQENKRPFEWKRANAFGSFKQFAKYPIMLPIAGVLFLSQLAHWTYPSVWSYYAEEKFAWTPQAIGFSLMFVGPHVSHCTGRLDAGDNSARRRAHGGRFCDERDNDCLSWVFARLNGLDDLCADCFFRARRPRPARIARDHVAHDARKCARGIARRHRSRNEYFDGHRPAGDDADLCCVFIAERALYDCGRYYSS